MRRESVLGCSAGAVWCSYTKFGVDAWQALMMKWPWCIIARALSVFFQVHWKLIPVIDAQLMSPIEAVCPENRVIFSCQQSGSVSRWKIYLSETLQNSAQRSLNGSILTFLRDPGFHFELHIVSNSSNSITSELQVTAVRELNGVTVECAGGSGTFTSTIEIASVDPPAAPSGVMATYEQFTKTGASVTVIWSNSRQIDNYTIRVIPPVRPGQISDFTTTDNSLQLTAVYNVNYSINITAQNCVGRNSIFVPLIVDGCSPPSPPANGRVNEYFSGAIGASLYFQCNTGYIPYEQMTSTCIANGTWVPIPQCMLADCGSPSISSGVVIEPFNNTKFDAMVIFHCGEDLLPSVTITAVCGSTGDWMPNPALHSCVHQSSVSCSAPEVPNDAHISNQSNSIYLKGVKVTFQCDNGSQALLTTTCQVNGDWSPSPSELKCNPSDNTSKGNVLSTSSQVVLAAVICSFVFFLFGILVGALCHRWATVYIKPCKFQHSDGTIHAEHPAPTDTPTAGSPVIYEDVTLSSVSPSGQNIELKENVAYGPI